MASGNWEKDLRDKLRHLAGSDATWRGNAVRAVFKEEEAMKRVILQEPDDETARQLVNDSIRRDASISGQAGAGAGAGAAADDKNLSSVLVHEMLNRLGPPPELPRNADELAALLEGYSQLKIPVPASILPWLKDNLNPTLWTLLDPVQGLQSPASKLSDLIVDPPMADGKEGSTALTMQVMFRTLMRILGTLSAWRVRPDVSFNLPERWSGSINSAVGPRLRPDMIVTYASCTMLIGEEADKLQEAERDIEEYGKLGIPAAQYGIVPGIPAYAASGSKLQFMFIPRGGTSAQVQVRTAGTVHDLDTVAGRLTALCAVIQCYRLMVSMWRSLPYLPDRTPLWSKVKRGGASITLTPAGAVKKIGRFKAFAQPHGMTQASLKDAYKAAAAAAQQQHNQGLKPFLVSAAKGPKFTGDRFEVSTTPLGYNRHITTEADARRLANSCLRAAGALHAAKVVHTDLRLRNIVWLDEGHCMVIDLEHCRRAGTPLPDGVPSLEGWDDQTLETLPNGKKVFMPASDLYQVGKLLQGLGVEALQQSQLAQEFVHMLLGKRSLSAPGHPLTAEEALQHAWLQAQ